MKIFSGTSNIALAEKVAAELNLKLSKLELHKFPDGEKKARVLDKVVEEDCIIVQPTNPPVDTHYMELFFSIDALRRSGAKSVTAVVPYLGYQRQDHVFLEGEAVSLEVIIETLRSTGLNRIITFDLHTPKIPELFEQKGIEAEDLSALSLFAGEIKSISNGNSILVSPDMGGIRRIRILSELLGDMPYATIVKNRDLVTGHVEAASIEFETGKKDFDTAFIVDDMISSGKTIVAAANLLSSQGINKIVAYATHPVFAKEAPELLQNSIVEKVIVTDSIDIKHPKLFPKLNQISIAKQIAEGIKHFHETVA